MTKKPGNASPKASVPKNAAASSAKASRAGKKSAAFAGGDQRELAEAIASFSLDAADLSPVIAARAYGSGGYPYADRPKRKHYQKELHALQIELLKLQTWLTKTGERIVLVFEGRDAAGKGGSIHRLVQHLNPRYVRVVALSKPTEAESAQWYFQRYVAHLPRGGEMAIFDRSWYNRAVVEPVMGFCTPQQTAHFLEQVPVFEKMLVDDGIRLFKFWLDIGREMQLQRLFDRRKDPLKHWKLSPVDLAAPSRWEAISAARDVMFASTHTPIAPWTVILSNDKMRARLGIIRQILRQLPYEGRDDRVIGLPDSSIVFDGPGFLARRSD